MTQPETPPRTCPDSGTCHHAHACCSHGPCWRVLNCGPLSSYGEDWTPADKEQAAIAAMRAECANIPGVSDVTIGWTGPRRLTLTYTGDAHPRDVFDHLNGYPASRETPARCFRPAGVDLRVVRRGN